MRTNVKIIAVLMLFVCVFALCSCDGNDQKKITGTWTVETLESGNIDDMSLSEWGASIATKLFFGEGTEVKFLSDGSFAAGFYNMKYKLVDDQLIFEYNDQTYSYDYEIKGDVLTLSISKVATVTLKKK